jgi:hypothetical protein
MSVACRPESMRMSATTMATRGSVSLENAVTIQRHVAVYVRECRGTGFALLADMGIRQSVAGGSCRR